MFSLFTQAGLLSILCSDTQGVLLTTPFIALALVAIAAYKRSNKMPQSTKKCRCENCGKEFEVEPLTLPIFDELGPERYVSAITPYVDSLVEAGLLDSDLRSETYSYLVEKGMEDAKKADRRGVLWDNSVMRFEPSPMTSALRYNPSAYDNFGRYDSSPHVYRDHVDPGRGLVELKEAEEIEMPKRGQRFRAKGNKQHTRKESKDALIDAAVAEQTQWGEHDSPGIEISESKYKVRTRRAASISPPTSASATSDEDSNSSDNNDPGLASTQPSAVSVPVSTTSKATFLRLFPSNSRCKRPLHFDDFASAMIDAGFSDERSGRSQGSAIKFRDEVSGRGSISFHAPHPDPRIDNNKLRTWGTRLSNKFGWEADSFVGREC